MGVLNQGWVLAESFVPWGLPVSVIVFFVLRRKGTIGTRPIGSFALAMGLLPLFYLMFAIPFSINRWGWGFEAFERAWRGVILVLIGTAPIVLVGAVLGLLAARYLGSAKSR